MNIRLKWISEEIDDFLKEEHTHAELVEMLRKIQDRCETISRIGDNL